jgi:uncharacterized protein YcsI (UPF0317 family)
MRNLSYCTYFKRKPVLEVCHLGGAVVSVLVTGLKSLAVQTLPRYYIFKDGKNTQHTFISDGKQSQRSHVVRFYGMLKIS